MMLLQTSNASIFWILLDNMKAFQVHINTKVWRCPCWWNFMLQLLNAVVTQLKWKGLKHGPPLTAILCFIIYETFNTITADMASLPNSILKGVCSWPATHILIGDDLAVRNLCCDQALFHMSSFSCILCRKTWWSTTKCRSLSGSRIPSSSIK